MEHKGFKLEIKEINDEGEFKGLLSTYGFIDSGGDRVNKGAFKNCLGPTGQKKIKLLWQHDTKSPIGSATISDSPQGLAIDGKLNLLTTPQGFPKVPKAHEAHALLINKDIDELSMGYVTNDYKYNNVDGQSVRDLLDVNVMESSIVTFAMNSQCKISEAKNLNGGDNLTIENKGASGSTSLPMADKAVKWDGPAASKNIFDKYTDDKGNISKEAQKAFFYVDTSKPNEKRSYKLGFADIVGDKLTTIPNGVKAAANAIRGARNPVSISDEDKKAVAKKINVYLKKLEFDEITDDQIKSDNSDNSNTDTTDKNKKSNPTELNTKALGFNAVYQTRQNREARWDAESALDQSLDSIVQDEEMTVEDKLTASNKTIDDFCTMYKQVLAGLISAMSQKSLNYEFETKSVYMERKAGKKISKSSKEQMTRCKDSLSDVIALLTQLCGDENSEDDTGDDDTDSEKSKGGKKTPKVVKKPADNTQNNANQQEKGKNDTLELKSSENLEILENISNLFKGDEQ